MITINENLKLVRQIYTERLTFEQFKENRTQLAQNTPKLREELNSKTVKLLRSILGQLGQFTDSRDKKADLVSKVITHFEDYFLLEKPVCYTLGQGTYTTARLKIIQSITADTLEKFYQKIEAKEAENKKALENPETIEEFRTFIRLKSKDDLSPEQLEKFELLTADVMLERQKKEQAKQDTVQMINNEDVEFKLHPTKHSKTGEDIFTVLMINRIDPEQFSKLRIKAKNFGGYYSKFTNLKVEPQIKAGFNFKSKSDAENFMELKNSDQSTSERKAENKEDKKVSAIERIRQRANKQIEQANKVLNQDRKTNTARRAAQAESTESQQRYKIQFAKKMLLIADGMESGKIKFLHALRNQKQLEYLENTLNGGYYNRVPYDRRKNESKNPPLDVNFIEYPYPSYGTNVIKKIFGDYSDQKGMKQDVKRILTHSKRFCDKHDNITLNNQADIKLYKNTALKISDKWDADRILDSIRSYERIQKMGLTNLTLLKTALRELAELTQGTELTPQQKKEIELVQLERSFITKKIDGFFPTPQPLIDRMFEMAKVFENETILEPSAGLGHIATAIQQKYPNNELNVIEVNHSLSEVLTAKGLKTDNCNFLDTTEKYDVIFMNPPFEKHQDIDHVKHAFNLLKSGGRLVSIMAGNKSNSQKKVTEFMEFVNEFGYMEQNEAGSFKSAYNSTGVSTVTIYLEKPVEAEPQKTIKEKCKDIIVDGAYMLF